MASEIKPNDPLFKVIEQGAFFLSLSVEQERLFPRETDAVIFSPAFGASHS